MRMQSFFMDDARIYLLLSSATIVLRFRKKRDQTSLVSRNFKPWITDHSLKMHMDEIFCSFFPGYCNFQNGNCGLKRDKDSAFHWTVGSGQTLTESTGPSYDHTSFRKDGKKTKER